MVPGVPGAVGADCHIHPIVGSLEMAHKDPLPVSGNLPCWAGKLKKKVKNKERTPEASEDSSHVVRTACGHAISRKLRCCTPALLLSVESLQHAQP